MPQCEIAKQQKGYRMNFNSTARLSRDTLNVVLQVFLMKQYYENYEWRNRLVPAVDGLFIVLETNLFTIILRMGASDQRVSSDRIVEAPVTGLANRSVVRSMKQNPSEIHNQKKSV